MKNFEDFMEDVQQELDESSLSRLVKKGDKGGSAFMSAERGDKSKKENKARTKQLAKDIRGAGLPGPTKVEGQYKEAGQDKPNKEQSYAIDSGKKGKKAFKKAVKKLGKKYDQDSVLIQKDKDTDAKLHATTDAGKKDLGKWDGKVGKMKPGGEGDMQTRIKGKTFTMEGADGGAISGIETSRKIRKAFMDKKYNAPKVPPKKEAPYDKIADFSLERPNPMKEETGLEENYGDEKYSPKKLQKDLPKGVTYGDERQGKGDHKTVDVKVDGKDTDMHIGGATGGHKSYSPSWGDGHRGVKKTLKGIDDAVSEIRGKKETKSNDTVKRMAKAAARRAKVAGDKTISDITGIGRKTNPQGHGNKAARRMNKD